MSKIDWKRKLSSRKFWQAIAGAIAFFLGIFGVSDNIVAQISEIIIGAGLMFTYIVTEGMADIESIRANHTITIESADPAEEEDDEPLSLVVDFDEPDEDEGEDDDE